MKPLAHAFGLLLMTLSLTACSASARETIDFDNGWRFARFGAMPDGSELEEPEGLELSEFDDTAWRTLDLPHDWGIEGPFRADLPNRTGKLPWAGIGWYRKAFDAPAEDAGRRVYLRFDGAMSGTTVFVNGVFAGAWPYGYASFRFDISEHLTCGETNTIAVRLDNKDESSRWYPGGGIYRHVWLEKTHPVAVAEHGVFVTTPEITDAHATVEVRTEVMNLAHDVRVTHVVTAGDDRDVLVSGEGTLARLRLDHPRLWDLDTPHLYRLTTTVSQAGAVTDVVETEFGVRTVSFTPRGFFLNGRRVPINGVCQHHDLGPLGGAANTRAMERQIEILKSFGVNAIRTAHNPPAPEFMDLCDRMGVLVQVESFDVWRMGKLDHDYHTLFDAWHDRDLRAMVRRDRNRPSVFMWSTGNETLEQRVLHKAPIVDYLEQIVREEDPSRAVSLGVSRPEAVVNGFGARSEVMGINYKPHLYGEVREKFPDLPFYASETTSSISSRGEYFFPVSDVQREGNGGVFQVSDYGLYASPNGYTADVEFAAQDDHPDVAGEFVWTGFDYLGEPTPYNRDRTNLLNYADPEVRERVKAEMAALGGNIPPRSSYFGIVDLCGFPKDRFYLYQARWMPELPMAHLLPHWNWAERVGEVTPVHVYTSGDAAELFLNGESLGRKTKGDREYRLRWDEVVYAPGELKVVAYRAGERWAEDVVRTTGAPAALQAEADRAEIAADGDDLSFVTVRVADESGVTVPRTHHPVTYTLAGPGEIVATGNGDPTSLVPFGSHERPVFNGLGLVIVRGIPGEPGTLTLRGEAEGLMPVEVVVETR